jgi:hypothetical protein
MPGSRTNAGRSACPSARVTVGHLEQFVVEQIRAVVRDPSVLEAERTKLASEMGELRAGRARHVTARDRLLDALGAGDAPAGLVTRVHELDELVAEADARIAGLERDLAALEGRSDVEALKAALEEFDGVWGSLNLAERARVLGLVLHEVTVDGVTGEAELKLRAGP